MCPTKQLIFWAIVATVCLLWSTIQAFWNEETKFIITAYYSPLPNQSNYTTGSYEWDKRLNGEGVITASWKWVFPGLLAGPSNYPFGTKLYFEWYGVWSIEDRGWAIVKAGERWHSYDRIDIWMGYWDEGLARALKWWKRTVTWKIVVPSAEVTISFPESEIGYIPNLTVNPEAHEADDVETLQEIFTKADLYSWNIDWKYESIENEIITFQINQGIIKNRDDESAWWFWPKTISALRNMFPSNSSVILREEDAALFDEFNHKKASVVSKFILEYWDLQVSPESDSFTIAELQELLYKLGEYGWEIDGQYTSVEVSLIDFQIKVWLITDGEDWGAGYFWNKTKSALWSYYEWLDEDQIATIEDRVIPERVLREMHTSAYTLSTQEKTQINNALVLIKMKLKQIEDRGGKTVEERLSQLSEQINEVKDQISDEKIKAKILYLEELL